jgi:predicted short-subunit dehydrogenase-like oxidoreductase (DUF2520 family)
MSKKNKQIILIGAGNVATQLGITLYNSGYLISQVYSRTKKSTTALAEKINAEAITDLKKLDTNAAIYVIAVKDDAIADIVKKLNLKNKIVVHTSGSVPIHILKNISKNYGVFYPLQTFSKDKKVDFKTTPICIEANNPVTARTLKYFARSISNKVQEISSDQRKTIHLAAVFANNFSNHLYSIAEDILTKNKLSFDLLKPLIEETAGKIKNNSPAKMQTGPAIRGDKKTIDAHLKLLKKDKRIKAIYKILSESILHHKL